MQEGGVRGIAFVAGGLVPPSRRGTSWSGMASQVDLYATLGALAGINQTAFKQSGPVPPDSLNLWPALVSGSASPRVELVHNMNGNWSGALRIGDFKLLKGHPNEANRGIDGYSTTTPWKEEAPNPPSCNGAACPCVTRPCLFQVGGGVDPEERNDLAEAQPAKLQAMLARWDELQRTEVTIEASGLCPQSPGINAGGWPDATSKPDGCEANEPFGHWQPWM